MKSDSHLLQIPILHLEGQLSLHRTKLTYFISNVTSVIKNEKETVVQEKTEPNYLTSSQ